MSSRGSPGLGVVKPVWLLCGLLLACGQGEEEGVDQNRRVPDPGRGPVFFSELVHVPAGEDTVFFSYMRACRMPGWEGLLEEGLLRDVSVFDLEQAEGSLPEAITWDFLILVQATYGTEPERVLGPDYAPGGCTGFPNPTHTVLRTEALIPTPNSYFPDPHPMHRHRATEIPYLIEFIGVEDTPQALKAYRTLMGTYFGPENGVLVEEGMLFSLVALETTEILFQAREVSSWNQLHLSGDLPEYSDRDWDSVYTELSQRLFSIELDSIWNQLPGIRDRPGNYQGRLLEEFWVH